MEARIKELRADVRHEAREEAAHLESKLQSMKETLSEGFDKLSEGAAQKLNHWLKDDGEKMASSKS